MEEREKEHDDPASCFKNYKMLPKNAESDIFKIPETITHSLAHFMFAKTWKYAHDILKINHHDWQKAPQKII